MMRTATILCLLAAISAAGERFTLTLAEGKRKTVELKSFDDEGLTHVQGGREHTVAWDDLTPESAYGARKALTPYDDGVARLELTEFARKRKLFPQALEQLEIALALGGMDEAAFEKRSGEIQAEEIAHLTANIDTLLMAKADAAVCLAAIKRLKERYPDSAASKKYEPHIKGLVEKLAEKAEAKQSKDKKAADGKALAALRAKLGKVNAKKVRALTKAEELREASRAAIALRQVSRVKKTLVEPRGAEKYYKEARKQLRAMASIDKQELIVSKKELQKEYEAIQDKLIECYLGVARILMSQRNYKGSVKYVRKILLYDPIHEEALEMVEEIRKNRISFRLSEITNARPRVTGG